MKLKDLLSIVGLYEQIAIIEGWNKLLYEGKNCYCYEGNGVNLRDRKVNKIECYMNTIYLYIERG